MNSANVLDEGEDGGEWDAKLRGEVRMEREIQVLMDW